MLTDYEVRTALIMWNSKFSL